MKLAASLIIRNELGRYLAPCVEHLLEFCDLVVLVDDASDDATPAEYETALGDSTRLVIARNQRPAFYEHEGRARQRLLDFSLSFSPTHVLPVDADEFVTDGPRLRQLIEAEPDVPAWLLPVEEVWQASDAGYRTREDGGWSTGMTMCWKVPTAGGLSFPDRKLACGRVPRPVRSQAANVTGVSILHVGWLDQTDRRRRARRYREHDGGRYHARRHLDSILWPDERVELRARSWSAALEPFRERIIDRRAVAA